jgi:hypothetical protein
MTGVVADGDDFPDTFVAANKRRFCREWPITEGSMEICMADL